MIGSGDNGQLTFIDAIGLMSFWVGLQNLGLNIDQNDLAEQTSEIDAKAEAHVNNALAEIHAHLEAQDAKLNQIIERMNQNEADRETDRKDK